MRTELATSSPLAYCWAASCQPPPLLPAVQHSRPSLFSLLTPPMPNETQRGGEHGSEEGSSERKMRINIFSHKLSVPPFGPGLVPATKEKTGLSLGQTRGRRLPVGKIRRKPGFVPGSSQDQPDKKVNVYVPFSCLRFRNLPRKKMLKVARAPVSCCA